MNKGFMGIMIAAHELWLVGDARGMRWVSPRADLRGSDLRDSNLRGSNLRGIDLRDSNLSGSNLRGIDLRDSNLSGSDLRGSDLSGSNLRGIDLRDSNLSGSDLRGSDLSGADMRGADICVMLAIACLAETMLATRPTALQEIWENPHPAEFDWVCMCLNEWARHGDIEPGAYCWGEETITVEAA